VNNSQRNVVLIFSIILALLGSIAGFLGLDRHGDFDNRVKKGKGDPVLVEATIHGTLRRGVTWLIALSPE